jgi:hypothetical protein
MLYFLPAMEERRKEKQDVFDLDALLHPASAFAHPMDVVREPDLTLNEKRAMLASWASDACAIEAASALRASASGRPVRWDEIMDALRILDEVTREKDSRSDRALQISFTSER